MGHRSRLEDEYTVQCPVCKTERVDPSKRPGEDLGICEVCLKKRRKITVYVEIPLDLLVYTEDRGEIQRMIMDLDCKILAGSPDYEVEDYFGIDQFEVQDEDGGYWKSGDLDEDGDEDDSLEA